MRTTTTHTTTNINPAVRRLQRTNALLWTVQALLAALFLYAGGVKLALPAETLAEQAQMSGTFLHFIGALELLGGLGLFLPGLTGIRTQLTPLAAAGLVIIMIGATVISAASHGVIAGSIPFVIGVITAAVAYGRTRVAPHASRQLATDRRPQAVRVS